MPHSFASKCRGDPEFECICQAVAVLQSVLGASAALQQFCVRNSTPDYCRIMATPPRDSAGKVLRNPISICQMLALQARSSDGQSGVGCFFYF